jgi:hypothetical protein
MERGPLWTVGWKEYVDFPDWGLRRIKVKIDTGARTSALDVARYDLREAGGGGLIAQLGLALDRKHPERLTVVHTPVLKMIVVANSGGAREERPLIETRVRLGPVTKRVCLTVTSRAGMRFPMILGRKALEGDFLVDVSQKYLLRKIQSGARGQGPGARPNQEPGVGSQRPSRGQGSGAGGQGRTGEAV